MMTAKPNLLFLLFALFLVGCGASAEANATLMPTMIVPIIDETLPAATAPSVMTVGGTAVPVGPALPSEAAVILVGKGETLNLRAGAGVENAIVTEVAANATGLLRTGMEAFSGEELWAEVRTSTAETGWVNARFLTEYLSPEKFCVDPKIQFLLDDLLIALQSENAELFATLVSPAHGLDLRVFHHGTLANYSPEEAAWVFQSSYEVPWGYAGGSGEEVNGTFSQVPLPLLLEVLGSDYELYCNDVGVTSAFAQEPWPSEYENINFYNVFKPGTEQYGGLDWRAWLVGIEYVDTKPYLFAMTHFEWEP